MCSPRSPYERHRFTPKRTRLRVDASAATRKAQRALKAARRRTSGVLQEREDDRLKGPHDALTTTSSNTYDLDVSMDAHGHEDHQTLLQYRQEEHHHQDGKSERVSIDDERPFPPDTNPLAETRRSQVYDQITPVKRSKSLVKSTRSLGTDFRSRMADATKFQATPSSNTRDSMNLVSPPALSGPSTSLRLDLATPSTLRSRHLNTSVLSTTKRTSNDMDQCDDIDIHEAEYKRPRSSPFQDSVAPVRFGSPERESRPGYRDSLSNLSVEVARKSSLRQSRDAEQYEEGLSFTRSSSRLSTLLNSDMGLLKNEHESGEDTIQHSKVGLPKENRPESKESAQNNETAHSGLQASAEETLPSDRNPALPLHSYPIESSAVGANAPIDTDLPLSRSRIGAMMPGKRVMGARSRLMGAPLQSQSSQGPTSRLNKQQPSSSSSSLSNTAGQSNITGTTLLAPLTGGKLMRTTSAATPVTGATSSSTKTLGLTASSSLFRSTVPRAPLPSMMRSTENSVTRPDSQNSGRKQAPGSKSTLTFKKTARTVLPDSTLTSKTFTSLFPGSSNSVSASRTIASSPKKDSKRETAALELKTRESTPDIPSTLPWTTKVGAPGFGEVFKISGIPERAPPPKSLTSFQVQKTPVQLFKDEIQKQADNPLSTANESKNSRVNNPFVAPAPARPPVLPSWVILVCI